MNVYCKALRRVRERAPLVMCVTNFVTVNDCANILLAAGASPMMTHDVREVEDAVAGAQALVRNMGAIENVDAMVLAGKRANALDLPVILDPVGVGGTRLRQECATLLLSEVRFAAIRGNASEIGFLAGRNCAGNGVDAGAADTVTEENLSAAAETFQALARRTGSVIIVSGALDLISCGTRTAVLRNGCAAMARITGSGCMLSSLTGALCGALPEDLFTASAAAAAVMGVCGELAEVRRLKNGTGNATFRADLMDAVFNLTEQQLEEGIRCEII